MKMVPILALVTILMAGSLFGKKPARPVPPPLDTQLGWHVLVFDTKAATSPDLYAIGDDLRRADENSVYCGVHHSFPKFLLSNGQIIENLGELENYISDNAHGSGDQILTRYSTFTFQYHLEPFSTQDILGRPVAKQHFTAYMPGLNPPRKHFQDMYTGIDSMFKGGVTVTIENWQLASHESVMSNIAAQILACDRIHELTGTACTDEDGVKMLRRFITQTPALPLVDPAFAKHDEYLSHFIH
jgi:hypothetical protein